eukprot:7006690-Pyramimonas_sp.AAC.1
MLERTAAGADCRRAGNVCRLEFQPTTFSLEAGAAAEQARTHNTTDHALARGGRRRGAGAYSQHQ